MKRPSIALAWLSAVLGQKRFPVGSESDRSTVGVIFAGQRYREFAVPALLSDG
jgi:hypothetical protein